MTHTHTHTVGSTYTLLYTNTTHTRVNSVGHARVKTVILLENSVREGRRLFHDYDDDVQTFESNVYMRVRFILLAFALYTLHMGSAGR